MRLLIQLIMGVDIMGVIVGIVIFVIIWNTPIGRFIIGNMAKCIYSVIAFSICMAIPIPVINILLAIWIIAEIWKSEIG